MGVSTGSGRSWGFVNLIKINYMQVYNSQIIKLLTTTKKSNRAGQQKPLISALERQMDLRVFQASLIYYNEFRLARD